MVNPLSYDAPRRPRNPVPKGYGAAGLCADRPPSNTAVTKYVAHVGAQIHGSQRCLRSRVFLVFFLFFCSITNPGLCSSSCHGSVYGTARIQAFWVTRLLALCDLFKGDG